MEQNGYKNNAFFSNEKGHVYKKTRYNLSNDINKLNWLELSHEKSRVLVLDINLMALGDSNMRPR